MSDAPKRSRQPDAPKGAQLLTDHELCGLFAEAYDAYDMMDERVRFDSKGRKWVFVVVKRDDHSELMLKLHRGQDVREAYIRTNILASLQARPKIEDTVRALDGALS